VNFVFPHQADNTNAAVEQKLQRAHACRMGPSCLHRATEVEAGNNRREIPRFARNDDVKESCFG